MSKLEDAVNRLSELADLTLLETDEKKLAAYANEMAQCWLLYMTWILQNMLETNDNGEVDIVATLQSWQDKSAIDMVVEINENQDNI